MGEGGFPPRSTPDHPSWKSGLQNKALWFEEGYRTPSNTLQLAKKIEISKNNERAKQEYRTRKAYENRGTEHCSVTLVSRKQRYRTLKPKKNNITEHHHHELQPLTSNL